MSQERCLIFHPKSAFGYVSCILLGSVLHALILICIQDMYLTRNQVYTEGHKTKAWQDAAGMVQRYSDDMVERWNKEIDTYLVLVRQ